MKAKTIILSSLMLMSCLMVGCSEESAPVSSSINTTPTEKIDTVNKDSVVDATVPDVEVKEDPVIVDDPKTDPVKDPVIEKPVVDETKVSTTATNEIMANTDGYIIFDNFENDVNLSGDGETNSDSQTDLGAMFNYYTSADDKFYDGGYWYAYDDTGDKGNSSASPDYVSDDTFEIGLEQGGYDGSSQCLHIKIALGDAIDYPFYGIGANIRKEGEYFDLSQMESLEFYAKGSGTMKTVLKTKLADKDYSSDWGDFSKDVKLTADWIKYSIKTEDFIADKYSLLSQDKVVISDAYESVGKIHFQTASTMTGGDEIDFYIDDIKIKAAKISLN